MSTPEFLPVPIPPSPPARVHVEATLPPAIRIGLPILLALVAFASIGARLDEPPQIVFDEAHYVHWSREIANDNIFTDGARVPKSPVNYEHPPLAKHLMAWSIQAFGAGQLDLTWDQYEKGCEGAPTPCPEGRTWAGCNAPRDACRREMVAFRFPGAILGASAVAAAYLLALRLFNSVPAGLFAAALLLLDTMWYLHSRMAMLDVFAAAFVLWGFALAMGGGTISRVLSVILFGAGLGSKYTAFFVLPLFVLVHYLRAGPRLARRLSFGLGFGLAAPVFLFVASYAPYLVGWWEQGGVGLAALRFRNVQAAALVWDFGGTFEHASASKPWHWVAHTNPTFYYWPGFEQFNQDRIFRPPVMYAVGNVALWWPAFALSLVVPLVLLVRARRLLRAWVRWDVVRALPRLPFHLSPARALVAASLLLWGSAAPFLVLQRTMFNYYATFFVPFLAVFLAGILHHLWQTSTRGRVVAVTTLAIVGLWYTAWWPLVSGAPIGRDHFEFVWGFLPWMSR